MIALTSAATLLLAAQLASAFNPATDRAACRANDGICLTSFIWCARSNDPVTGCTYPEDAYPWYNRDFPSNPAALLDNARYNLSWDNHDPSFPVEITWTFGTSPQAAPGGLGNGSWTRNVTDASFFEFSFAEIIGEFPTEEVDLSRAEVYGLAGSGLSTITVRQPDIITSSGFAITAASDPFIVFYSYASIFLETQAEIAASNLDRKWTLGVGIGVGLGAPLLMLVAFLGGWVFGKRKGRKATVETKKLSSSS